MKKLSLILLTILMAISLFSCAEPEVAPPKEYTVSFEGITKEPVKVKEGENFILPAEMPSKKGHKLIVQMGETVLEAGKKYKITADTVLKCSWEKLKFTLTVDGKAQTVEYGDTYTIEKTPTGKKFISVTINGITSTEASITITEDTTVDYIWEYAITYAGLESVPKDVKSDLKTKVLSNEKFKVPYIKGYYIESIKLGDEEKKPGTDITLDKDITLTYTVEKGSPSLLYTYPDANGNVSVKQYAGESSKYTDDIVIPDMTADGVLVTSIGDKAFYLCNDLTSVLIPDSVTSIGGSAFAICTSLTSITISEGVTSIGKDAFWGCASLTSITIPEGVTSIGKDAFGGCASLTSITIPDSVTSIGFGAFNSSGLTEIHIPEKAKFAEYDNPFASCSKLKTITVDSNNKKLKSQDNCILSKDGITLIACASDAVIPAGVKEIQTGACAGMDFSSGTITIPDGVTSIGVAAFAGCTSLTSITIPDSVTSIGDGAFFQCAQLTTINVCKPESECTGWGEKWNGDKTTVNYDYTPTP